MSPSGGVITVVDQPMMWSPENRAFSSFRPKQMWLEVWPGVARASMVQPWPSMICPPPQRLMSGEKPRSAPASVRIVDSSA